MSYGRTGLILREWVERGGCWLDRKKVYLRRAESYEKPEIMTSIEYTEKVFVFPSVFLAQLFVRRYEERQFERCRKMVKS